MYARTSFVVLVALMLCALVVVWNAGARSRSTPARQWGTLYCAGGITEDGAAHVRLVEYTPLPDGTVRLRYVCRRAGY